MIHTILKIKHDNNEPMDDNELTLRWNSKEATFYYKGEYTDQKLPLIKGIQIISKMLFEIEEKHKEEE